MCAFGLFCKAWIGLGIWQLSMLKLIYCVVTAGQFSVFKTNMKYYV